MEEVWKDINGYEGYYQISNLGRVKSLSRKSFNGKVMAMRKERILKNFINDKGYYFNILYDNKYRRKQHYNHRLVAEHFIPNPENKPCVNHINCNPLDNSISNLEWCTHKENMNYCMSIGRHNMFNGKLDNSKPLINLDNGVFYNSKLDASYILGISIGELSYHLKRYNKYKNIVFA